MVNDLLLLSGTDIPFQQAQINIHQPTIKEISYIGEEALFVGCELLNFSKDMLSTEDKTNLEDKTNFEVLMSIMKDKNLTAQKNKVSALMVLTLMFPGYEIHLLKDTISFSKEGEEVHYINSQNFESFKEIVVAMFCLKEHSQEPEYNPAGKKARELAEKMRKGRQKAAAAKGEHQKIALLSRYVSILAVGENKGFDTLLGYTVYQLFDEFNRFELKQKYDIYVQAKMAGAKDLEEVDNWMKDIHS
jgi:hypothetical protein